MQHIKAYAFNLMAVVIFLGIITSGCATSGKKNDRVEISGNSLDVRNLKVSDLHSIKLDNIFKAQATIHNTNSFTTAQAYYRCNFYDKALFKVQETQQWIPIQILANQSEVIECSTTNPDAATFKVELSSSGRALNANN